MVRSALEKEIRSLEFIFSGAILLVLGRVILVVAIASWGFQGGPHTQREPLSEAKAWYAVRPHWRLVSFGDVVPLAWFLWGVRPPLWRFEKSDLSGPNFIATSHADWPLKGRFSTYPPNVPPHPDITNVRRIYASVFMDPSWGLRI